MELHFVVYTAFGPQQEDVDETTVLAGISHFEKALMMKYIRIGMNTGTKKGCREK
jgi:hypothetical protein